jgi:hypothetical protein
MAWILQHKLVALGIVVLLVGGVFYGLMRDSTPEPLLTNEIVATGSPTSDSADQQLVESLLTLRAVSLSGTIFQDPAFRSLKDSGTGIVPEPIGRQNPFAPIGHATASTSTPAVGGPAGAR